MSPHDLTVVHNLNALTLIFPFYPPSRSSSLSRHQCRSGAEEGVPEGCPEESAPLVHLPTDTSDRSQNVWQWMLESERQGKHRSHR